MRDRTGIWLAAGALFLVFGYYGYWFFTNFERREREVLDDVSEQARRNPLLAAERFLERIGRDVESVAGRDRLLEPPPAGDVLLVNRFGANLPPEREDVVLRWLEEGGHLILAPVRAWDEDDEADGSGFLESFGIRLERSGLCGCGEEEYEENLEEEGSDEVPDDAVQTAEDEDSEDEDLFSLLEIDTDNREAIALTVAGLDEPMTVSVNANRILYRLDDEEYAHLVQMDVGAGRLSVLSDIDFLHNDRIGDEDHARFIAALTQGDGKVWLLYSSNMPSLISLLWRHQPYLVLSACLLVGLWMWWLTGFTGARRETFGTPRRNLLEHLDAAAGYAWRVDRARQMSGGSRQSVLRAWVLKHPALQDMDRATRCDWIAGHSGLPAGEVEFALYAEARDERELIRISAARQGLLAALTRRKRAT